jgi:hypothetical protein
MWRWIIRIWASVVLFWCLTFMSGLALASLVHFSVRIEFFALRQWIRDHDLLAMFLLGVSAGMPALDSRFTGRGWFRSKTGLTYEGFKLAKIKKWMWLLASPVLVFGIVIWFEDHRERGALHGVSLSSFYHELLMPNCSGGGLLRYRGDTTCSTNLLTVGIWIASIGYSLAPAFRSRCARLLRSWRDTEAETDNV